MKFKIKRFINDIYLRINTDRSQNDKNFTELIISNFTDP